MPKESFLLVSLKEDKAKKLAQVISNESCRKILDYLAEKEATETELAKNLQLPLSTVHYNLQHLMEGGLITVEEFHYSPKGKEVNHYKLANKYIIIAPKTTFGIKEKLKSILPVTLIVAGTAFVIEMVSRFSQVAKETTALKYAVMPATKDIIQEEVKEMAATGLEAGKVAIASAPRVMGEKAVAEVANATSQSTQFLPQAVQEPSIWQNIALWFLMGALFAIFVYLIISWIRKKE